MTPTRRLLAVALTCVLLGAGVLTAVTTASSAAGPKASLNSVGDRYAGDAIPVVGYLSGFGSRYDKTLYLQRKVDGTWRTRDRLSQRADGRFAFPSQRVNKPQMTRWRVVVKVHGHRLDVSRTLKVNVIPRTVPTPIPTPTPTPTPKTCASDPSPELCPRPQDTIETQTVVDTNCQQLVIAVLGQARLVSWTWSTTAKAWVKVNGAWETIDEDLRPASAEDCLSIIDEVPQNATLPDLRMKSLDRCGAGDMARTNGTCFLIEYDDKGRRLLKFAGMTFNVGAGPSEIIADRSAEDAEDWKGYQTFYDAQGNRLGSMHQPGAQFYFAGDGHDHWHVRDFDSYELLDAAGTTVNRGEKHGYCLQDNTSYGPMEGDPGIPDAEVYLESTSCGKGLPNALTIVHGLSRGWGDTYPTTLPDQGIDITGLPDGDYTVRITADDKGAVTESNEGNNTAQMLVTITGDTVTTHPETSIGGLD